jgi:hypothetical protein
MPNAADDEPDTSRAVVQTYVPEYQKREWGRHAEELDMSQSEFVRTMVQAGRRGFDGDSSDEQEGRETRSEPSGPQGQDLETVVEESLAEAGALDWDELLDEVTADVENRLEDAIESLQADNRVRYSGPKGGYTLIEDV